MYFSHVRLQIPPTQQEKIKQDSKDEAIIIVDDEEENIKSKEETPLKDEEIRDEIRKKPVLYNIQNKGMKTLKRKIILKTKSFMLITKICSVEVMRKHSLFHRLLSTYYAYRFVVHAY